MNKLALILVSLFSYSVFAEKKDPDVVCKTITVCYPKKKKPKAVVPPLLVPTPLPPLVLTSSCPEPKQVVKAVKVFVPFLVSPKCPKEGPVVFGLHLGFGLGVKTPYHSGLIGARLEIPKAYLGFELYSALQYGMALQSLIYVYRGPVVKVHVLDPGVFFTGLGFTDYLNNPDVPRKYDLLLGAGVQVKLHCNVSLTVDWRVAIPDPKMVNERSRCNECDAYRLNGGAVVGNAFASSQLLAGLLFN